MTSRLAVVTPPALRRQRMSGYVPQASVTRPLTANAVETIASEGFPLVERLETLILRNRRITAAYHDLANQLTDVLANGDPARRMANWCTFATWSSKTIGAAIDPAEAAPYLRTMGPSPIRSAMAWVFQRFTRRDHGSVFRALAAGNRFIFLEVGLAVATLIEALTDERDRSFDDYWTEIDQRIRHFADLDPSWVLSQKPDPDELRKAMVLYWEAARHPHDNNRFAELILAANVQLAAYEQRRADGYVATSMAIRGGRAWRRLLNKGTGEAKDRHLKLISMMFAWIVTRYSLALLTPSNVIRIGRRLPPSGVDLSLVFSQGIQPILVGFLVWGIGLSLGGPTGYAINPARDLGPRLAHALLPIAGKGKSDWGYAWVPIIAPLLGGLIGAGLFTIIGF